MDNLIYTHLYSSTSFVVFKGTADLSRGTKFLSTYNLHYAFLAYFGTFAYKLYNDPAARKSLCLLTQLARNNVQRYMYGESKTKNKPVRKMKRPKMTGNQEILDKK